MPLNKNSLDILAATLHKAPTIWPPTGCLTKAKDARLPNYLPLTDGGQMASYIP